MSDQRRGRDSGGTGGHQGGRGGQGRGRNERRPGGQGGRAGGSGGRSERAGRPSRAGRDDSSSERRGGPSSGDRRSGRSSEGRRGASNDRGRSFSRARRDDREPRERTEDQRAFDGPEIPEGITGRELDRSVTSALSSLPEKLALRVARHLVAAGQLIETDPKTAYQHTLAARARAGRLSIVREAVGEAAYAAGEFSEALAELRAARRMNGSQDYLAVMADCERALGRPDKALTLVKSAKRDGLGDDLVAELVIVEAGARRDRGEIEAALRALENGKLMSKSREPWVARLRYVYADTLTQAGKTRDAVQWFHRAEAVDVDGLTDAGSRAAELESE